MSDENKEQKKAEVPVEPSPLEKVKKERDEYLAGWQRARADFLNYKKEETERLARTVQFANEDLVKDLLSVLDSFSLVEASLQNKDDLKPFLLVRSQLENALRFRGLEKLKTQKGSDFNPELHEAVEALASEDLAGNGLPEPNQEKSKPYKILEIIADGYYLHGKLIRPAKVRVGQ